MMLFTCYQLLARTQKFFSILPPTRCSDMMAVCLDSYQQREGMGSRSAVHSLLPRKDCYAHSGTRNYCYAERQLQF